MEVRGAAALVSFYIHCHTAAMGFDGTVHALFRANLHPAACENRAHNCYPFSRGNTVAVRAWHSEHCDDATDALAKLVRKGGPAPTSVRYVAGLLRRCARGAPATQTAVRDMICSSLLGGYAHSTWSADPECHAALLAMTTPQMAEHAIGNKGTKQLHHMVAEYVCANTLANDALVWSVGPIAARHAACVAEGMLRIYGKDTLPTPPSSYSTFMTLMRALNVNASVSTSSRRVVVHGMVAPTRAALEEVAATPAEIAAVNTCFDARSGFTLKAMRAHLKNVGPSVTRHCRAHVWAAIQACRVRSLPLCSAARAAQVAALVRWRGVEWSRMPLCMACCTPRVAVIGMRASRCALGTATCLLSDAVHCNACGSDEVIEVDMVGRRLGILAKRFDKAPAEASHAIAICCSCGQLTSYTELFGIYPVCAPCLQRAKFDMAHGVKCLCGARPSDTALACVFVTTPTGGVDVVGLCARHVHLAPDHPVPRAALERAVAAHMIERLA